MIIFYQQGNLNTQANKIEGKEPSHGNAETKHNGAKKMEHVVNNIDFHTSSFNDSLKDIFIVGNHALVHVYTYSK